MVHKRGLESIARTLSHMRKIEMLRLESVGVIGTSYIYLLHSQREHYTNLGESDSKE